MINEQHGAFYIIRINVYIRQFYKLRIIICAVLKRGDLRHCQDAAARDTAVYNIII